MINSQSRHIDEEDINNLLETISKCKPNENGIRQISDIMGRHIFRMFNVNGIFNLNFDKKRMAHVLAGSNYSDILIAHYYNFKYKGVDTYEVLCDAGRLDILIKHCKKIICNINLNRFYELIFAAITNSNKNIANKNIELFLIGLEKLSKLTKPKIEFPYEITSTLRQLGKEGYLDKYGCMFTKEETKPDSVLKKPVQPQGICPSTNLPHYGDSRYYRGQ